MISALPIPKLITIPPEIAVKIGSFAPQLKNGITLTVATLSFSSANVLVLIIAGTEQPNPIIIGINALPDSPNLLKILSKIKATLAIYPVSSKIENSISNNKICGINDSTEESPPKIPSHNNPVTHAGLFESQPATPSVIQVIKTSISPCKIAPGEFMPPAPNTPSNAVPGKLTQSLPSAAPINKKFSLNTKWNIANKINKNIGIPHIL